MGSIEGWLGVRRLLGAVARPEEGSRALEQVLGSGLAPRLPLSGPAGHSAPWEGYVAWTAGASCTGASSFAIRIRL